MSGIVKFIFPKEPISEERLMCAFYMSDNVKVHRQQSFLDVNEMFNEIDPSLVCNIWNHTRHFGHRFGYYSTPSPAHKSVLEQCK